MKSLIFQKLKQEYSHLGLGMEVLQAHAEALAATGLVTAENVDTIVSSQAAFLESIQKANDQRVTSAQKKAKEDARREFEANAEEAKRLAEEEAKRKAMENEMPDWYKREKEAHSKNDELLARLAEGFEAIKKENEAFKLEKANAERKNLILTKAKELGIPEYRIKEGFSISADADEAAISEYLTTVSNNIKANQLPSNKEAFPMSTNLKKEDIDSIAKGLVI